MLAAFTVLAPAQVSGPHVNQETGQQTYQGNTTDPDFSPYTPEQQNWNRNNLGTAGAGTAHVGSLQHYVIRGNRVWRNDRTLRVRLGWAPPSQEAARVAMVGYEIVGGRIAGTQPIRVVMSCPAAETIGVYQGHATGTLNLNNPFTLRNCSPPVEAVQASCFLIMLAASPARAIWMATRGL